MPDRPVVLLDGLRQPECLRWHDGALWFSDMHARRVYRVGADGRAEVIAVFDDIPGGLGFTGSGSVLVTLRRTRRLVEVDANGRSSLYVDLSDQPGDDLNDIVVDGGGRIYLGNNFRPANEDPAKPLHDTLLMVTADRDVRTVADQLARPNGIAVTPDGSTLIVASTRTRTLTAFSIERDGSLTARRNFAEVGEAAPDGICMDVEGAVWVGSPATTEAFRVFSGGPIVQRIPCGPRRCVCVALGGSDRRTLFMATWLVAPDLPKNARIEDHVKTRGWIETARVESPGAGWP